MNYRILDHTADLALEIKGKNMADLFSNAGMALYDQITDPVTLKEKEHHDLLISGQDREDLMVNWLRELLYLWTGKQKLVKAIKIKKITATSVAARVFIDTFSLDRHEILAEIKAVTYHNISVKKHFGYWSATIVFDL